MKVAITGASGHVGAALVRALLEQGAHVRALVRGDTRAIEGLDVERVSGDVADPSALERAFHGVEVVYHAAARITLEPEHDPAAHATNVDGTRNVLQACKRSGARRLVHFSTVHALRPDGAGLLGPGEGFAYERSKVAAEKLVLADQEVDAVIVSPCAVVGPFDHKPSHIGRVLLMLERGLLLATVTGGQSWVDVRDIALAATRAAERGRRGARYVVSGHFRSMQEFSTLASRAAGVRAPLMAFPAGLARAFAPLAERGAALLRSEPLITRASLAALEDAPRAIDDAAARDLGHAPRPLEETLRDTFDWFRAQKKLRTRR
ncbi:MAG: NAD-dependent epimerase/dehydratase family protein [Polyangiaceae bacterium]